MRSRSNPVQRQSSKLTTGVPTGASPSSRLATPAPAT
jgi:hypothetical protein